MPCLPVITVRKYQPEADCSYRLVRGGFLMEGKDRAKRNSAENKSPGDKEMCCRTGKGSDIVARRSELVWILIPTKFAWAIRS